MAPVRAPLLRPADPPAVPVRRRRRPQRAGVRARARLGERERADRLAARERRHEPLPLLVGAERDDRERRGARVHRDSHPHARVGARELLEHEDVRDEVGACSAELLGHADAHQAELAELREELPREAVLPVPVRGVRRDLGVGDLAGERLDLPLLVGQGEVHGGSVGPALRAGRSAAMPMRASPTLHGAGEAVGRRQATETARREHRAEHGRGGRTAVAVADAVGSNDGAARQPSSVSSYASCSSTKNPADAKSVVQPSTSSSRNQPWSPGSPSGTVTSSDALRREHATQLTERVRSRAGVVLGVEPVAGVVGADVLEGRDEQHLVDAVVGQRKRADVRRDPLHPLDVALGEVDPDELDARHGGARRDRRARRTRSRPRPRARTRRDATGPRGSR